MSCVMFLLILDIMDIYRIFHNHIKEILQRFPEFDAKQAEKAFMMYKNFVQLTNSLKDKGKELIVMFDFTIKQPEYYEPDKEMMETLETIVISLHE